MIIDHRNEVKDALSRQAEEEETEKGVEVRKRDRLTEKENGKEAEMHRGGDQKKKKRQRKDWKSEIETD